MPPSAYWDIDQPTKESLASRPVIIAVTSAIAYYDEADTTPHCTLQFLMRCSFPPSLLRRPRTTFRTFRRRLSTFGSAGSAQNVKYYTCIVEVRRSRRRHQAEWGGWVG